MKMNPDYEQPSFGADIVAQWEHELKYGKPEIQKQLRQKMLDNRKLKEAGRWDEYVRRYHPGIDLINQIGTHTGGLQRSHAIQHRVITAPDVQNKHAFDRSDYEEKQIGRYNKSKPRSKISIVGRTNKVESGYVLGGRLNRMRIEKQQQFREADANLGE